MNDKGYTGVILAAGRGSRMAPFSENYPKPILPICNQPLIEYQIGIMKSVGITDIVILVGHRGFEISKVLGDGGRLDVKLRYVEQTSALGIAHAVGRLEPHVDRPFLLLLGDVFFVPRDMKEMFEAFERYECGAVLAAKEEASAEAIRRNFSISLEPDGSVSRVVEKPRYTSNRLKGVGVYVFDLTIFDAIRRTPRTAMRDEYEITDAIQVLIDDGHRVRSVESIEEDVNLTTPADLLRCNLAQARRSPSRTYVGSNSELNPNAKIDECVIGDNVTIIHPIHIFRSLIFTGSRLDSKTGFEHFIVTPERVVDCNYELKNGTALS